MEIEVNEDMCLGTGHCVEVAPKVFEVKDGKAHVKMNPVPEELESEVQDAVFGCPSGALMKT